MKKNILLFLSFVLLGGLISCSKTPEDQAKLSVELYLEKNLKKKEGYESIMFSTLDTIKVVDKVTKKNKIIYTITHFYSIKNSENEEVKMSVPFYLDKDFAIIEPTTKSLNGDYGVLNGSVYWKYNNYIGNRPDTGSEVVLYSLDSIRNKLKYEVDVDVQGNYRFEKVLAGKYFLLIRSKNTTDCPDMHLAKFSNYSSVIKDLFGFNIDQYKKQLNEIDRIDSIYSKTLSEFPYTGTSYEMEKNMSKVNNLRNDIIKKSENLIDIFPEKFKNEIKLFGGYSKAFNFSIIEIQENKTVNENVDFGITCI